MFSFFKRGHVHDFSIHRHSSNGPKTETSSTLAVSEQQPRSRSASPSPSKNASPAFSVGEEVLVVGDINTPMISAMVTHILEPLSAGRPYRYRVREKASDRIFGAVYPESDSSIDGSDVLEEGRLVKGSKASLSELVDSVALA
ncbi:hypothetical protein FRB90_000445 [Tulasnella sp. 427]|nr:hypothetical protein FRB90_000445 [Tulasnella sp. 427]